jgi:hypothetical protein
MIAITTSSSTSVKAVDESSFPNKPEEFKRRRFEAREGEAADGWIATCDRNVTLNSVNKWYDWQENETGILAGHDQTQLLCAR